MIFASSSRERCIRDFLRFVTLAKYIIRFHESYDVRDYVSTINIITSRDDSDRIYGSSENVTTVILEIIDNEARMFTVNHKMRPHLANLLYMYASIYM